MPFLSEMVCKRVGVRLQDGSSLYKYVVVTLPPPGGGGGGGRLNGLHP